MCTPSSPTVYSPLRTARRSSACSASAPSACTATSWTASAYCGDPHGMKSARPTVSCGFATRSTIIPEYRFIMSIQNTSSIQLRCSRMNCGSWMCGICCITSIACKDRGDREGSRATRTPSQGRGHSTQPEPETGQVLFTGQGHSRPCCQQIPRESQDPK